MKAAQQTRRRNAGASGSLLRSESDRCPPRQNKIRQLEEIDLTSVGCAAPLFRYIAAQFRAGRTGLQPLLNDPNLLCRRAVALLLLLPQATKGRRMSGNERCFERTRHPDPTAG